MNKSFISAIKHDDGTFSGIEQLHNVSPSGFDRWSNGVEDTRRFETSEASIEALCIDFRNFLEAGSDNLIFVKRLKNALNGTKIVDAPNKGEHHENR